MFGVAVKPRQSDSPSGAAAIDAVGIGLGGGAEVVRDAVAACAAASTGGRLVVFVSNSELLGPLPSHWPVSVVRAPGETYAGRLYWWLWGCRRAYSRLGVRTVLYMGNIGSWASGGVTGLFVQQVLALDPDPAIAYTLRARFKLFAMGWAVRYSAERASRVFVQSEHVAETVRRKARTRPHVEVIPPEPPASLVRLRPVQPHLTTSCEGETDHKFIYVGSSATHKNLRVIFDAGALLPEESGMRFVLTVLGETNVKACAQVTCVGSTSREGVAKLLANSTALVMPSLAETVGLPMLEAMDFGVPVIAADRPYAHSICGDAAHYFDPLDPQDLLRACSEVAESSSLREKLVRRGTRRCDQLREAQGFHRLAVWLWTATEPP